MTEPLKLLTQLLTQQGFFQEKEPKEKLSTSKLDALLVLLKRLSRCFAPFFHQSFSR